MSYARFLSLEGGLVLFFIFAKNSCDDSERRRFQKKVLTLLEFSNFAKGASTQRPILHDCVERGFLSRMWFASKNKEKSRHTFVSNHRLKEIGMLTFVLLQKAQ